MRRRKVTREWYLPLTILGISGLGALLLTNTGRKGVRWLIENLRPERLLEWNETAQHELDRIQLALNRVAESLGSVR